MDRGYKDGDTQPMNVAPKLLPDVHWAITFLSRSGLVTFTTGTVSGDGYGGVKCDQPEHRLGVKA